MSIEKLICPRRGGSISDVFRYPQEDEWRSDKTCSYCGSMHPDEFMRQVEEGVEVVPTDKSYKVYFSGKGKFYFEHLSVEQRVRFIELLNEKKVNIGDPGYFYVLPFFCQRTEAEVT